MTATNAGPRLRRRLSIYQLGRTPVFASRADQRFSYCLCIPASYAEQGRTSYPLAVVVHGTERNALEYRDQFVDFAEAQQCVVLAPLFPAGIIEPGEVSNYKFLTFHDIRFDRVLLGMVDEVAEQYRVRAGRFLLHGFSGGGQFAHRFFYLHPRRLLGLSIGAPGRVTLLDPDKDWWHGVGDFERQFGQPLDYGAMRGVPVQMVIGARDTKVQAIRIAEADRRGIGAANQAGRTRMERLDALRASFERAGIAVRHDVVPGVGHEGFKVLEPVKAFFSETLAGWRAASARAG